MDMFLECLWWMVSPLVVVVVVMVVVVAVVAVDVASRVVVVDWY